MRRKILIVDAFALAATIPCTMLGAQSVPVRVPPTTISPVGNVHVPLLPGGRYNVQLPVARDVPILDVTTTVPGVTISTLPNGPEGEIRRQIHVDANADATQGALRIVSEGGEDELPLIVAPAPPPPPGPPPDGDDGGDDSGRRDDEDTTTVGDSDTGPFFGKAGTFITFIGGIALGAWVARRRRAV